MVTRSASAAATAATKTTQRKSPAKRRLEGSESPELNKRQHTSNQKIVPLLLAIQGPPNSTDRLDSLENNCKDLIENILWKVYEGRLSYTDLTKEFKFVHASKWLSHYLSLPPDATTFGNATTTQVLHFQIAYLLVLDSYLKFGNPIHKLSRKNSDDKIILGLTQMIKSLENTRWSKTDDYIALHVDLSTQLFYLMLEKDPKLTPQEVMIAPSNPKRHASIMRKKITEVVENLMSDDGVENVPLLEDSLAAIGIYLQRVYEAIYNGEGETNPLAIIPAPSKEPLSENFAKYIVEKLNLDATPAISAPSPKRREYAKESKRNKPVYEVDEDDANEPDSPSQIKVNLADLAKTAARFHKSPNQKGKLPAKAETAPKPAIKSPNKRGESSRGREGNDFIAPPRASSHGHNETNDFESDPIPESTEVIESDEDRRPVLKRKERGITPSQNRVAVAGRKATESMEELNRSVLEIRGKFVQDLAGRSPTTGKSVASVQKRGHEIEEEEEEPQQEEDDEEEQEEQEVREVGRYVPPPTPRRNPNLPVTQGIPRRIAEAAGIRAQKAEEHALAIHFAADNRITANLGSRGRKKWTDDEYDALVQGMTLHGTKWHLISSMHDEYHSRRLIDRTQIDLKDKARNEYRRRLKNALPLGIFSLVHTPRLIAALQTKTGAVDDN